MKITLFYRNATILDYAYLDDHLGLVGNSLRADVEFVGRTDEQGVVYDFSHAKKKVKEIIDRCCDHRLVVPQGLVQKKDDRVQIHYAYGMDQRLSYQCPEEGVCAIPFSHVSTAHLETFLERMILPAMPPTVLSVRIKLVAEDWSTKASFHYTHGLKEHYGNCQRLFHGHCNTVDVKVNGVRSPDHERYLAEELFKFNVHFCKWENVVNQKEVAKACGEELPEGRYLELPPVAIEYRASQGVFKAELPGRAVYFLQAESTVENLSAHFAKLVKAKTGGDDLVTVWAYEGIAKGAQTTL